MRQLNLRARRRRRRRLRRRQRVRTALLKLCNSTRVVDAHALIRRATAASTGRREALKRREDDRRRARAAAGHRRADAVLRGVHERRVVHGDGPRRVAREPEALRTTTAATDGRVRRWARAARCRMLLVLWVDGRHAKGEADVVRNVL